MKTVVVIPAFNEETAIYEVVRSLQGFADRVIVVNDGSSDRTAQIAESAGALVVHHAINRGYGAASTTGIAAALKIGADTIVTFDADGQHRVEDIARITKPIEDGDADIVIGCRTLERQMIPLRRRAAHGIANALTYLLFGLWVQDSQSGLRAFSKRMAENMDLKCDRMEFSSEVIREIKKGGWRLVEIPIVPIYTEYSLSKGQGFFVGIKTAWRLVVRKVLK